jgi:hypothetical protein
MTSIDKWDKETSIIYDTYPHKWDVKQITEWLTHFVRIPIEYCTIILKHISTGSELMAVTRIQLRQWGIPWGLCSHIDKAQEQLNRTPLFKPVFVDVAKPYPWPYNGDLRLDNTALIIIDMQKDFVGDDGYAARMYPASHALLRGTICNIHLHCCFKIV